MPHFEFIALSAPTRLDRERQRITVQARATVGDATLLLGDVWRSVATEAWHFTMGGRHLQVRDGRPGFGTREAAAEALFAHRLAQADQAVQEALARANTLRVIVDDHSLQVAPPLVDERPGPG